MRFDHRFSSVRQVPAHRAWADATSLDGIAAEMPRWLRLRTRPAIADLDGLMEHDGSIPATLYVGPVPVVRWTPRIAHLDREAHHFVERSERMSVVRDWQHERRITPLDDQSSRLEDRVSGRSVVPGVGIVVSWLFRYRHRRIAAGLPTR